MCYALVRLKTGNAAVGVVTMLSIGLSTYMYVTRRQRHCVVVKSGDRNAAISVLAQEPTSGRAMAHQMIGIGPGLPEQQRLHTTDPRN